GMADEAIGTRGDEPAMCRHQSERSPECCQAQAADHDPEPLKAESNGVQRPGVGTAGTKQRSTEGAEVGGDPNGSAPAHQRGGPMNAEQHGGPEAKQSHAQPDHTTGLDRVPDVDHGEYQPKDRATRARREVAKRW